MTIIVDDREKVWKHIETYFTENNINFIRKRLQSGDYTFYLEYDDNTYVFAKQIVIERKNSLSELAACFGKDRDRFEKEFVRLKKSNTLCFLIVEEEQFDGINRHEYMSRITPKSMENSLMSWLIRYNIIPIFTNKENTGRLIYTIFRQYVRNTANNKI